MADRKKRRIHSGTEEDKRKSAKRCDNEDVEDDERIKEYRVMLEKVGQLLNRDALKRLCQLQNLSAKDKERIFQASCCDPSELFMILEERGKLGVSDVSCLTEDLATIGYTHAVQLIHDYRRNMSETIHSEDEDDQDLRDDARNREYLVMLEKVGQCLNREALTKLIRLENLSSNEEEKILQANSSSPSELFKILEERGTLGVNNVSCLREDLSIIDCKGAVQIIDDYLHNDGEELPSEPESDDENRKQSCVRNFEDMLKIIGLEDRFPGKLHLEDFLNVRLNGNSQSVVYSFWRKITCLDYHAGLPQNHSLHPRIHCSMRDFIFSILHCADDFLRQDILEKMSACQLAIPILLTGVKRDESPIFLRWACGTILKKWKGRHDSFSIEQPVISHPLFTVSFLRIGEVGISKSQLLNYMLGPNQGYGSHPYFLTKEFDKLQPKFSLGSVESVWFLPTAGSENEGFRDAMTFLNLRDDCRKYPKQREFACKAANLTVVLVPTDQSRNFKDLIHDIERMSTHTLFVSIREDKNASGKIYDKKNWIFLKRTTDQIEPLSAHLSTRICELARICELDNKKSILSDFNITTIDVDETKSDIQTAKKIVSAIFGTTNCQRVVSFKSENFLLQAHWKEIAKVHKERFAFDIDDNKTFEEKREQRNQTVKMYRSMQLKCELSNAMKYFLDAIKNASTRESTVKYFWGMLHGKIIKMVGESINKDLENINNLKEERNNIITKAFIDTSQECHETEKASIRQREMQDRDHATCEFLRVECEKLHEYCTSNNLGCEHFLREIGQQYEAYTAASHSDLLDVDTAVFPMYPKIVAQLILQMQSFELMDGDTECVPITWVTAVLDALRHELNNPKVLVVSVIGVQSSGKSTLLNSMFGLRFPVRAGRCTRGLFMRLLKVETLTVEEKLMENSGPEYLIVVDTEGLRSIDHEDHTFDNELVTFALSIANVTIFNISGENISADVAGVLQIAAHALMRMKEVDLECKCFIIQQRVSDLTAADRNKASTHKIKETLNEATKFAAEEEGLEGRYKEFSDVVDLKFDEDLQYVPNLWAGGMTPPNHMYGEKVTKVRESLLQDIRKGKIKADLTMSTFTDRVRDVWSAVKEENFIFNFQDSVKAVDFNQFCLQYNRWIVEMRQAVMNECLKCLDNIPSLIDSGGNIESLKVPLDDEEDRQKNLLRKYVEKHITNHPRKVMVSKYKQGFLDDVNIALKDAKNQALQRISEEYDIRKLEHNLPKLGEKWLVRMITDVKGLAEQIRISGESTDSQNFTDFRNVTGISRQLGLSHIQCAHSRFHVSAHDDALNELWKTWTKDMKEESGITQINISPSDIKALCDKLLVRMTRDMAIGSEIHNLFEKEGGIEKHIAIVDFRKYINDKQVKAWIKRKETSAKSLEISCELEQKVSQVERIASEKNKAVGLMQRSVQKSIDDLKQQTMNHFDTNVFQLLVRKTLTNLSEKTGDIKLPDSLIAKGLMHLCGRAFHEVFKNIKIKDDNFRTFFKVEDEIAYHHFHRYTFQRHIMEQSASEFMMYFIQKQLERQVKENVKSLKYTKQCDLPWDILQCFSTTSNIYHLVGHYTSSGFLDVSLSNLVEYYFQRELAKTNKNAKDQLSDKYITKLLSWEQDLRENLSFKDWIDRLVKTFTIDSSIQHAVVLYDDVQPLEVSRSLRYQIQEWNTQDFPYSNYRFWKIATGLSSVCNKTCPMCGMFCDNTIESHTIHSSHLHRPRGMAGETYPHTHGLVLEDCSTSIQLPDAICTRSGRRFLCKDYKHYHADWEIHPYRNNPGKIFWRFHFVQLFTRGNISLEGMSLSRREYYRNCLIDGHPKFPGSWFDITESEALQSLKEDKELRLHGRCREPQSGIE